MLAFAQQPLGHAGGVAGIGGDPARQFQRAAEQAVGGRHLGHQPIVERGRRIGFRQQR